MLSGPIPLPSTRRLVSLNGCPVANNVRRVLYAGKRSTYLMTFLKKDGTPQDLTGAKIWLTAKTHIDDTDSAIVFDVSTDDGNIVPRPTLTDGLADVIIEGDNTDQYTESTVVYYDVQILPAGAATAYVEETGTLLIRVPTKRGNT